MRGNKKSVIDYLLAEELIVHQLTFMVIDDGPQSATISQITAGLNYK